VKERLDAAGLRIERVALGPGGVEKQRLFRIARPLYAMAGWRARLRYGAMQALVATLGAEPSGPEELATARAALAAAVRELEENVTTIERAAILRGRAPVAHAAWLRRLWEIVVIAERAVSSLDAGAKDVRAVRQAGQADPSALVPPLTLGTAGAPEGEPPAPGVASEAADAFVTEIRTRDRVPEADADVRVVELELASIDHLIAAARGERNVLSRKRRLLVAARQRLLEAGAALPLDQVGAKIRADYVAGEIARIDRLEGAGIATDVGLVHQARTALHRGDARRLHAAVAALDSAARASGDGALAQVTSRALARLWHDEDPSSPAAVEASLRRSAHELLGDDVVGTVAASVARARRDAELGRRGEKISEDRYLAEVTDSHLAPGAEHELFAAALNADGCFEVGGALSPLRIVEEERVLARVRFPTRDLELVPAHDVMDLPDAIIADPRTVLLDLAAGRLLARRFVREEVRRRTRVVLRSEVRVYVLDGSGSMLGPRARVRDGLLLAELATVMARLRAPGETRCTLFFRYFDELLGPVTRVDSVASAREAIRDVVSNVRTGGTDIQAALLASLEQIAIARELDPDLARAQIVLVTDGEAAVGEAAILAARDGLCGLPIGISVIALGQENRALRGLVARQRSKGETAFYHFLDDEQLGRISKGGLDAGPALHLPPERIARSPQALARDLEHEVGPLIEELEALERARDLGALERLDEERQARRELGLHDELVGEGERGRIEALHRDHAALLRRFERWFPAPCADEAVALPAAGGEEREDVDAAVCALASVAEVVELVGGSELARRADAIELLERLLPDAGLTPARYRAVLRDYAPAVSAGLSAVQAAVRPPDP
jgi:hypothetical protein